MKQADAGKVTRSDNRLDSVTYADDENDAFKQRISVAITNAGGVTKVSNLTGYSQSVIRKWRSGQSDPTRKALVALATAGKVSISWLATGEVDLEGKESAPTEQPQPQFEIDLDTLEEVSTKVLTMLEKHRPDVSARAKARIVRLVYEFYLRQGEPMDEASLNNVIELAAFRY